ncbi:hypothetical protein TKK_0014077 [Trichogramma kaykai]
MFGREIEIKIFSRREEKDDSHPIMDKSPKIARRASTRTPNRPIVKDITESETLSDGSPDHCYISWSDKTQKEIRKWYMDANHGVAANYLNDMLVAIKLLERIPNSRDTINTVLRNAKLLQDIPLGDEKIRNFENWGLYNRSIFETKHSLIWSKDYPNLKIKVVPRKTANDMKPQKIDTTTFELSNLAHGTEIVEARR